MWWIVQITYQVLFWINFFKTDKFWTSKVHVFLKLSFLHNTQWSKCQTSELPDCIEKNFNHNKLYVMNFSTETFQGVNRIFSFSWDGWVFSVRDQSLRRCCCVYSRPHSWTGHWLLVGPPGRICDTDLNYFTIRHYIHISLILNSTEQGYSWVCLMVRKWNR